MKEYGLSYNTRKSLQVHLGEAAGTEIANLIAEMAAEIEQLRKTKVNITKIVPGASKPRTTTIEETV